MHACTGYAWSDCACMSQGVHDVTFHAWFGPFTLDLCHVILNHCVLKCRVHFLIFPQTVPACCCYSVRKFLMHIATPTTCDVLLLPGSQVGRRSSTALSAMDPEPMVVIHDASCLLPVDYKLAKSYRCVVVQALESCISKRKLRHVIPSSSFVLLFLLEGSIVLTSRTCVRLMLPWQPLMIATTWSTPGGPQRSLLTRGWVCPVNLTTACPGLCIHLADN